MKRRPYPNVVEMVVTIPFTKLRFSLLQSVAVLYERRLFYSLLLDFFTARFEQKIKNVTFLNPLIYLVYPCLIIFIYPSTPKIDIHPKYPEHNSDVSELVPALQDKGVFSDHQYLQQHHNMHYF